MFFEKFFTPAAPEKKEVSETEVLAARLSQELGLSQNGLAWALADIAGGDTAELTQTIEHYGLQAMVSRPEVIALAKKGLKNAQKEKREAAVSTMRSLFGL